MPVWHASISIIHNSRPLPVERWAPKQWDKARRRLLGLLAGVGSLDDYWSTLPATYHLRRRLKDSEMAMIDPTWMALPAIDRG